MKQVASLVSIVLLVLISGVWRLTGHSTSEWLWLSAGLMMGVIVWWVDQRWGVVHAQRWLQHTQPILISRSIVTLGVVLALTIYLMTSSGSLLGIGMCLAVLVLAATEIWQYRHDGSAFVERFLWQVKVKEWSSSIQNKVVYGFVLITAVCVLLLWL